MFGEVFSDKAYSYIAKRYTLEEWSRECWRVTTQPDWIYEKFLTNFRNIK